MTGPGEGDGHAGDARLDAVEDPVAVQVVVDEARICAFAVVEFGLTTTLLSLLALSRFVYPFCDPPGALAAPLPMPHSFSRARCRP